VLTAGDNRVKHKVRSQQKNSHCGKYRKIQSVRHDSINLYIKTFFSTYFAYQEAKLQLF